MSRQFLIAQVFQAFVVVLGEAGGLGLAFYFVIDIPALFGDFGQVTGAVAGDQDGGIGLFFGYDSGNNDSNSYSSQSNHGRINSIKKPVN